jgi:hypothetical protein
MVGGYQPLGNRWEPGPLKQRIKGLANANYSYAPCARIAGLIDRQLVAMARMPCLLERAMGR